MYFINPYSLILEVKKASHEGKKQVDAQEVINMIRNQKMWGSIGDIDNRTIIIKPKEDLESED